MAVSFSRCDWLFPPSAREVSPGDRSNYKSTRERVDSKGLYGRWRLHLIGSWHRAVIKRRGPGISPGYYEYNPRLLSKENTRKIEPKEIPSCLIPCLLVLFTLQLEVLVTTLQACILCLYFLVSQV